ncbi:MAG: hypothetical protein ABW098_16155 [Candidatus Thiodiazotropha sp.]
MNRILKLFFKIIFTTILFAMLFVIALLLSTAIAQRHIHPDNWIITKYDITTGFAVVALYLYTVVSQIGKAIRQTRSTSFEHIDGRNDRDSQPQQSFNQKQQG